MKKYLLAAASALLLAGASVAQDNPDKDKGVKAQKDVKKEDKKKLREYEEIIIKRKDPEKDTKVTIEIKDDEVFVDGKPIDDFVEGDITVQKRGPRRFRFEGGNASPFRLENGGWSFDSDDMDMDGNRPFLGVTSEGSTEGAKVTMVSENSAAAKGGLKAGDVITKVDDKAVFDHEQLSEAIAGHKPNDKVTITYKRDGKENKASVTLGERPRTRTLYGGPDAPVPPIPPIPPMMFDNDRDFGDVFTYRNERPRLGLQVQDTEDGKGVKVLGVDEGSVAEKAGIKKDDVITSFEGKDVTSASDLARASREMKDKSSLKVQLNRNGKSQTIDIKVPKKLKTANL